MAAGDKKAPIRVSPQPRFDWTEVVKLGNAELDEQHERMFLLADALVESLVYSGADNVGRDPSRNLQALIDFSYEHFRFEEDLMRSAGYPGTEQHANEHSELLVEIAKHRYEFQLGHPNVAHVMGYMRNWINRHIDAADRELVVWLRSHLPPAGG